MLLYNEFMSVVAIFFTGFFLFIFVNTSNTLEAFSLFSQPVSKQREKKMNQWHLLKSVRYQALMCKLI